MKPKKKVLKRSQYVAFMHLHLLAVTKIDEKIGRNMIQEVIEQLEIKDRLRSLKAIPYKIFYHDWHKEALDYFKKPDLVNLGIFYRLGEADNR